MSKEYSTASYFAAAKGDLKNAFMTPDDIVASEKAGQQDLINSANLPKDAGRDGWDLLKSWGVQVIEDIDDLFYSVNLPSGWIKRAESHDMWSYLIDDRGRKRASIFYKAAFYDRRAKIHPIDQRFYVTRDYGEDSYSRDLIVFVVRDGAHDSVLQKGSVVQYAYKTNQPDCLGIIVGNEFLFEAIGDYGEHRFKSSLPAESATAITMDEFYKNYHHVNPCHDVIYSAENAAKNSLDGWIENFLNDRDQWEID